MAIISQKSVQVVAQPPGLNPLPLSFYLSDGIAGQIVNPNPLGFVLQNLSPGIVGQSFTRSSGPDFDHLVTLLTQAPSPVGKLLLSFNLSASPPGAASFYSGGFTVDQFVPGGNAPNLSGACFDSFDLRVTDFSQSAPDANGRVTGSITVEFTINGCYLGSGVIFHYLPSFLRCFFCRIVERLHTFRRHP